ncbi:MAG: histidine--tRNA ligase [Ureaplasma sp.]|nr:histidine--tRNA ligase [Ureaplasma sp.]
MTSFKKPRGTSDWYGIQLKKFNLIIDKLKNLAFNYDFDQIDVPTFESIELFNKSIGETTDINQKELYTIIDKKQRVLALRPEGTSSVVRAYVENKMYANNSVSKLFYVLNLFRYERPQSGRLREFHQFGIEYLNVVNHLYDIECLIFAIEIIKSFNLSKFITLKINYLGNFSQREKWIKELKEYFEKYRDNLTEDSINRLSTNPLRILDDKIDSKKDFVINAPKLKKYLTEDDNKIFNDIINSIKDQNIKYEIDDTLVRGLDYYTGIVFEFVYTSINDPSFSTTIIGGGRYSDLICNTGGPNEIGLGFAIGLERLLITLDEVNYNFNIDSKIDLYISASNFENSIVALNIAQKLRENNKCVVTSFTNFKKDKNAHNAIKKNAHYFIYIDDSYDINKKINIEDLTNNIKVEVLEDEILSIINK